MALSIVLIALFLLSSVVSSQGLSQRPTDMELIRKEIWSGYWDMWRRMNEGIWVGPGGEPGQSQTYTPPFPLPSEAMYYEDVKFYMDTNVTREIFESADFVWNGSNWTDFWNNYLRRQPNSYYKHSPDTVGLITNGEFIRMTPSDSTQEEIEALYGPGMYLGFRLMLPRYVEWYGKIPKTNFTLEELKVTSQVISGEFFTIGYRIFNDSQIYADIPIKISFNDQEKSSSMEVMEYGRKVGGYRLIAPINQTDKPQEYYLTVEINPVIDGSRKYEEDKHPYYEDNIRQIVVVVPPEEEEKSSPGGMGRPILVR